MWQYVKDTFVAPNLPLSSKCDKIIKSSGSKQGVYSSTFAEKMPVSNS